MPKNWNLRQRERAVSKFSRKLALVDLTQMLPPPQTIQQRKLLFTRYPVGLHLSEWDGVDCPATLERPQKQHSPSHLPYKVWIFPTPGQIEPSTHIEFRLTVHLIFFSF